MRGAGRRKTEMEGIRGEREKREKWKRNKEGDRDRILG